MKKKEPTVFYEGFVDMTSGGVVNSQRFKNFKVGRLDTNNVVLSSKWVWNFVLENNKTSFSKQEPVQNINFIEQFNAEQARKWHTLHIWAFFTGSI